MTTPEELPAVRPHRENARLYETPITFEAHYDITTDRTGQTTSGQTVSIPRTEHQVAAADKETGRMAWEGLSSDIPLGRLTPDQMTAIQRARVLQRMRDTEDPARPTFAYMHQVVLSGAGVWYLCAPHSDANTGRGEPYAPVHTLEPVCDIDFVTSLLGGQYSSLYFYEAEIPAFAPEGTYANSYALVDNARIVTTTHGQPLFHMVRMRLFAAVADMETPVSAITGSDDT